MDVQPHQKLLREQQLAYRKLNAWEAKERLKRLPTLSTNDSLTQYFQLIAFTEMTADKNQSLFEISQIERWQRRADLLLSLDNRTQKK